MRPPGGAYLRYPNTSSVSHIDVNNPPANIGSATITGNSEGQGKILENRHQLLFFFSTKLNEM